MFDKPIEEWTLKEAKRYCDDKEGLCDWNDCPLYDKICEKAPSVEDWHINTHITEREINICKMLGANYITKSPGYLARAELWKCKEPPHLVKDGSMYECFTSNEGGAFIAFIDATIFPNLKEGDCIAVEDA